MLSTLKAVLNNCNQRTFIKNINRVKLEKPNSGKDTNNITHIEGSKEGINNLSRDARVHNLKLFMNHYLSIRFYRFFYVSLPAVLTAAYLYPLTYPLRVEGEGDVNKYTKETTIYNFNEGEATTCEDVYDLSDREDFFKYKIMSPEGVSVLGVDDNVDNQIDIKVHDYESAFTASISWGDDGKLQTESFSAVLDYLDTCEFSNVQFLECESDEEYEALFDRIIEILKESRYTDKDDEEFIDTLNSSDKKEIIMTITKYSEPEKSSVMLSKSEIPMKIFYLVMLGLVWLAVAVKYYARRSNYSVYDYRVNNGCFYETEYTRVPGNLFNEALNVKEAFLAGERDRIIKLWEEIKENVALEDQGKLLTKYEKKLIKKETNEIVPKK